MAEEIKISGKTVGRLVKKDSGQTHYVTERRESKDGFVRKHQGFGINAKLLKKRLLGDADLIVVRYHWESGSQSLYKLTPRQWIHLGVEDVLGQGYGRQIFVSEAIFKSEGKVQGREVGKAKLNHYERRSKPERDDPAQMRVNDVKT